MQATLNDIVLPHIVKGLDLTGGLITSTLRAGRLPSWARAKSAGSD